MITVITPFLGTVGTLSLLLLFYILARLSERFGSVIKMRPLYRYYYLALIFLLVSYVVHLLAAVAFVAPESVPPWFSSPWFYILAHSLPLAIGVTIGLFVTWRYWSWLVAESNG